jgi:hypothetical protein
VVSAFISPSDITLQFKYATPEGRDEHFASFKIALKEIDDHNAYSRSTNSTAVFGINSTSDIPSAGIPAVLGHYGEEPFEIDDEEVKTVILPASPFSRFPGLQKTYLKLPKRYRLVTSMTKYDANLATSLTTERCTDRHLNTP